MIYSKTNSQYISINSIILIFFLSINQNNSGFIKLENFQSKEILKTKTFKVVSCIGLLFMAKKLFNCTNDKLIDNSYDIYKESLKCKQLIKLVKESNNKTDEEICTDLQSYTNKHVIDLLSELKWLKLKLQFHKFIIDFNKYDEKMSLKIETMISDLDTLVNYIEKHKKYFELSNLKSKLAEYYKVQLNAKDNYPEKSSIEEIKRFSRVNYSTHREPLNDCLIEMNSDINNLVNLINKISPKYSNLLYESKKLKNNLIFIKHIIKGDKDYYEENMISRINDRVL